MFHFANPAYLLLALAIPVLLGCWLRQRRRAVRHPGAGLLASLPSGRARLVRWGGAGLRGLALLGIVIALAGPRWPDLRTRIDTEGIALVILVDVSGSMAEQDFDWNGESISRLESAHQVFRLFVGGKTAAEDLPDAGKVPFEGRSTDLIGLVTFATRPETIVPRTLSHSALLGLLKTEKARDTPGESETNLSDALTIGLDRLLGAGPRRKVLILLTDGEHNVTHPQSGWTPLDVAQRAAVLKIPIYTIDTGSNTPGKAGTREAPATSSPESTRLAAVETLREMASLTHGRYFAANDTAQLLEACRAIDRLERSEIQSFQYRRYHEGYPWFALGSFLLLCLVHGLEMTVWRRLP
jgi:Ca-activated chloride channel family protein